MLSCALLMVQITGHLAQPLSRTIRVGMMFVDNQTSLDEHIAYRKSASAVLIARDRIAKEGLLPGINFEFFFAFDECDEKKAAGNTIEMILNKRVDVILGPTCNNPTQVAGIIAGHFNKPLFTWGLSTSSIFSDSSRFPTVGSIVVNSLSYSKALLAVLEHFEWNQFAFVFSKQGYQICEAIKHDVQTVIAQTKGGVVINYVGEIITMNPETIKIVLNEVAKRARMVVCIAEARGLKRMFMLAAHDAGFLNSEFVYIMASPNSRGFRVDQGDGHAYPLWVDRNKPSDARDHEALQAFRKIIIVSSHQAGSDVQGHRNFTEEVVARMKDPPFFCNTACQLKGNSQKNQNATASRYASQLHDAFYAYAKALNSTISQNVNDVSNGTAILENIQMEFIGESGLVILDGNGTRVPTFYVNILDQDEKDDAVASIFVTASDMNFTQMYKSDADLWFLRGGIRPPAVPKCGFQGYQCPPDFLTSYLIHIVIGGAIIIISIITCIGGVVYSVINKRAEMDRLNQLWQISFASLVSTSSKDKIAASYRSLQSSTGSAKTTVNILTEKRNYDFYLYENDTVAAHKHEMKLRFTEKDAAMFRKMRQIENDNINRFIGICYDGPKMLSVWRFCSRGSIHDILMKGAVIMDGFFVYSLLSDIANGLSFIHHSFLRYHGNLTAKCCFVDDRWQVKVSDYGIEKLRLYDKRTKLDLLWTAPEILRDPTNTGTQEGDIYSFGIICAQIITRSSAWDLENRKDSEDELIYMVKKGGHNAPRPSLDEPKFVDINPDLLHLIRDCWVELPSERPPINTVKSWMRSMNSSKSKNLMDHVFQKLETYASTLESEIEDRTKELIEEKKKSDILLYRMLPRQIAEKLKLGQSVEPELYASATVFFSDVVSFTTIAARGSPLEVISLLNNLYTLFDSIIERHDVYKVETIGDAYLCVSGLPKRNGREHVKEICSMSLEFMEGLVDFCIPHLPSEKLNLRIGVHTGSVVAGVVGLAMPRYCLFGDTVNTASRMESNGKPGMIHLSADANNLLQDVGGYQTELRGEVIIKGKGVMETYWLRGRLEDAQDVRSSIIKNQALSTNTNVTEGGGVRSSEETVDSSNF